MIPTWRGVGPNTAVAWGSIAGWRSGPCRGCTAFAGSGCGPIERVRSMMPSSRWLQLSYVCGSYDKVFLLGALKVPHLDFWRIDPKQRSYYLLTSLEYDLAFQPRNRNPGHNWTSRFRSEGSRRSSPSPCHSRGRWGATRLRVCSKRGCRT